MNDKKKVTILGVPVDLGAENLGVDTGPSAFRFQKITEKLTNAGFNVTDAGDIKCEPRKNLEVGDPKLKYLDEIVRISLEAAQKSFGLIKKGERVVALGGDHSQCLGVISGASAALGGNLGLIYIDAHGDLNTPETTPTGNIHGMPLAALLGFGEERLVNIFLPRAKIKKGNMLHVGGNDFDKGELELINRENLSLFKVSDMLESGLKPLLGLFDELAKKNDKIWVSMDLDAVDEMYAPGVGMPNKAGFTYREITAVAEYLGHHANVVGVDINEYNPLSDVEGKTAELGIEIIAKLFGESYSWYSNYLIKHKI
ncbi:MAG TPA: arginase [Candidatus Paceibacterota bacterium]